jgi:hypothetical protein
MESKNDESKELVRNTSWDFLPLKKKRIKTLTFEELMADWEANKRAGNDAVKISKELTKGDLEETAKAL